MASTYIAANLEKYSDCARPFTGARVYFSGAIRGATLPFPDVTRRITRFLMQRGAEVLSEHVGADTLGARNHTFLARTGIDLTAVSAPWEVVRRIDTGWVDSATHLIAVVDGPSHGVGMEIERALLKPERGLARTPILCLVHEELLEDLSWMIRGVSSVDFHLQTYKDVDGAERLVGDFLRKPFH